jgi:hypothetical protein
LEPQEGRMTKKRSRDKQTVVQMSDAVGPDMRMEH